MNNQINKFDIIGQVVGTDFQTFVDNLVNTKYNVINWKRFFKRGVMDISDNFTALEATTGLFPMASVIPSDAPKPKRAVQGVSLYQGKIPMLGHGFDLTADDLRQQYILLKHGGQFNQKEVLDIFFNNINKLIFGIHARLNSMAMMAISTGHIVLDASNNPDGGVIIDLDMRVPTLNKKWAGWDNGTVAAWTDPSATPLTDIQDLLDYADDNDKTYSIMYFHKSLWRTFIRHPNVVKQVRSFIGNATTTGEISTSQVKKYMLEMDFPPIAIIDEKSGVETDGIISSVNSFDTGNVVLATAGQLGEVKFAEPIVLSNDPSVRYAQAEDGRISLLQSFNSERKIQSFEVEAYGIPILAAPKQLMILDTTATSTWT